MIAIDYSVLEAVILFAKSQRHRGNPKRQTATPGTHFPQEVVIQKLQNMGLMEVAVVSGILKFLGNKLAPLLNSQYSSTVGATRDLQELHDLVEQVNYWLETVGDKAPGSWLTMLKDVAYAADSFVDELQLKAQKHNTSGIMSKYISTVPKSFLFRTKAKAIKNRFAAIVRQIADFSVTTNSLQTGHSVRHINKIIGERTTVSIVNEVIVGRDRDTDMITAQLVEINNQHDIKIVSIIGLGGSGKTTLAKLVFNDNIIGSHFEVRLWIHVSLDFDLVEVMKKLFEAITGETSGDHSLPHISNTTSSMLMGKRFLIVLDDIWMEDSFIWDKFMVHLKNCAPGSRILLTTRNMRVAKAVNSTYVFKLELLSLEDSWILFRETLGTTMEILSPEFEMAGRDIVKKCRGVPIAIKSLASVLRGNKQIEKWHAIRDGDFIDVEGEGHSILESLILSYFYMPSHLKQCFAICSVFPKGYIIDKEKLIDLWIAHDMITPENGVEYLEHIGNRCFKSLLELYFLQDVSEGNGRVTCTMYDMFHDLALAIMGAEISLLGPEVATSSTKSYRYFSITKQPQNLLSDNLFAEARAMYVAEGDYLKFGRALQNAKHLRSITVKYAESVPTTIFQVKNLKYLEISGLKCEVLPEAISDIWSLEAIQLTICDILSLPKSFGNLKKLRTLNLSWCKRLKSLPGSISSCHMISNMDLTGCIEFEVLPEFIGTNKRLRVLRLSNTKIRRLPSSITLLWKLECLDLQQCSELVELPEGLENLENLEVLNLKGCPKLRAMLVSIEQLRQQQNLNILVVGESGKPAKISELKNVNGITYVIKPGDERKACLAGKMDLQRLQLHWGENNPHKETNLEAVFDGLQPPSGIKELYVGGYAGGRYAQWMLKQVDGRVPWLFQFPFLTVMTLCGLRNINHLDYLMGLPSLEELDLQWMPSLKSISGGPFPSLVKLRMEGLRSLEAVWIVTEGNLADGEEGQMQIGVCLSELHIEECPKLTVKPYFPSSLKHLVLHRSNGQLLLSSSLNQGPSSSSGLPSTFHYSHLKELELWGMTTSASSPPASGSKLGWELLQCMTALESIKICQCSGIIEMPESIWNLTSLRSLFINFCPAISMLPEWLGELQSLQKMTIQSCHSLSGLPQSIGHLTSLQELRIECCDELHQLPERLGELCSLRKFDIASLKSISLLPKSMCHLTSLEELEISECQGLTSLPGLPALQKLKITGCPELERRSEKEKGEDWHLIKHIPRLQIGLEEGEPAF